MKYLLYILIILILFTGCLSYYGLFAKVTISEAFRDEILVAYNKHIGDYKEVGKVTDLVYERLNNAGITTTKGFGLYFDNPEVTDKDKLRSIAGCIIEKPDNIVSIDKIEGVKIEEIPASNCIIAEFPYNGKLSIIIGVFRVYPKLMPYIENKGYKAGPIMEIYDVPNKKLLYISAVDIDQSVYEGLLNE